MKAEDAKAQRKNPCPHSSRRNRMKADRTGRGIKGEVSNQTPLVLKLSTKNVLGYYVHIVSNDNLTKKKMPFAAYKDSREFQREVYLLLIKEFAARQIKHISAENLLTFQHGGGWNFQRQEKDGFNPHSGEMKLQSSTVSVELDRVLKNDVTLISDFIHKMADAMEGNLFSGIIKEMGETAQETGNAISIPKEGMTGEAFLEMIQRTEVHVGAYGKVSKPSFYLAPEVFAQMKLNLDKLGPEFEKKVDALWIEKESLALQKEAARLARYDLVE